MKKYAEFLEWNKKQINPWLELAVVDFGGVKRHKWATPSGIVEISVNNGVVTAAKSAKE